MEVLPGSSKDVLTHLKDTSSSFIEGEKNAEENRGKLDVSDGTTKQPAVDSPDLTVNGNSTEGNSVAESPQGNSEDDVSKEDDEWLDILGSGHLKKKVLKAGEKDCKPLKSNIVKLKYVGKLENGQVVEDVELTEINLGDFEVIHGLDLVLALMERGEEAEVIIKSRFAFGELGRKPDIPPNATLIYTVSLIDFDAEPFMSTVNYNDRLAIGLKKKERGNWWYTRDEFSMAINCYRRALDYFDDTEFPDKPTEDEIRTLLDERLKTYNNLGASQIKISSYDAALISFGHVLAAQPNNVKALFRKSTILKEKGELQEAIGVIQKALSIEPENRRLQNDLQNLLAAQRRDNTKQRAMYKKMMGNSQDETDKKKTPPKSSSRSTLKWVALVTAFTVAAASIAVVKFNKIL